MSGAGVRSHALHVTSLYRQSLKLCRNWAVDRAVFRVEADKIARAFREHQNETNPHVIAALVAKTERILHERRHPDPYVAPTAPGGTKWQRNVPPPANFQWVPYPSEMHGKHDAIEEI
eukprot:TRINITY_DN1046_c0_g1_i2.p1 TRINITY_DN1046_c0_g1~~TRINITY_DN1046_c0_g1_i2.p1  ORF type:complete len:118 (+),score=2.49 TRINITY_DN1046_c0_g1_i2:100-453(+)